VNVFITGGTGLVGRHVIAALRGRGDGVRALARTPAAAAALEVLGATPVRGDLGDDASLRLGLLGCDAVVHAAASVLAGGSWRAWHEINVRGTERVARCAAERGLRVVHLSSVAVYGRSRGGIDRPGDDEGFDLERAPRPREPYARSKREAELALWRVAAETGLAAAALRPCVIYGEGDRHFSPRIAAMLRRGFVPAIGDGANVMTIVYAGNVAAAVTAALDRPEATGPFNITNDGRLTVRAFVERFAAGLGVKPRWVHIPRALAWSITGVWDATLGSLPLPGRSLSLTAAVQFLAGENRYASDRAVGILGWRPPFAADAAAERTGASFRAAASSA